MINITIANPSQLKATPLCTTSAFITFSYDSEIIQYVKNISKRFYDAATKTWEIPSTSVAALCDRFIEHEITIEGQWEPEIEAVSVVPQDVAFKTKPFNHQVEGVLYGIQHDSFLLGDDQGLGKALSLDTLIYTPTGAKKMRDIQVGDKVFDENGNEQTVSNIYNHTNVQMYDITFSDGVVIRCCKDHLWRINDQGEYKVVDTNWFLKENHLGIKRMDALRNKTNWNYFIPLCKPANFINQEVPLDPYLVGCLLGDGSITGTSVGFTTADDFIVQELNQILYPDYVLNCSKSMENISYNIIKTEINKDFGNPRKVNKIRKALDELGLMGMNSHTKFIPDIFKFNSIESRISILQGLMDTDGYAGKDNLAQYTTVSKRLKDDVRFLVESLGGMARVSESDGAFTLTIQIDDPTTLFRLPRKLSRVKKRRFTPHRNIVKIEEAGREDAKCISVTGISDLYLCEHFVVTHNTKQIIDLAVYRKQHDGMKHCLIICGVNGNKYNWVEEIRTHSNEASWVLGTRFTKRHPIKQVEGSAQDKLDDLKNLPAAFFLITNIETLRALSSKKTKTSYNFPIAERLQYLIKTGEIGLVAFDEAHKAKNPTSQQGQALLLLSPKYAIPMSGTFLMNNPLDLYFPLYWTGYETHSFYQYKMHYCVMGGYGGSEVVGYKNLHELRELLDKVMLRRLKQDVLDLPPKIHVTEYVDMYDPQRAVYQEVQSSIRRDIDKIRVNNDPLSQLIRLRQATGFPGILSNRVTSSSKMDRMKELVDEIVESGQKVIVFSQWEQMTAEARNLLKQYAPAYITGGVDAQERMRQVQAFQEGNCNVIIGTIGAMGTGITLNAASNVIFLDEPWNRALKDQAEDRAHRIGTKGTIRVITLVTKNTIDEGIAELVYKKGKMSDLLVDGKTESGKVAQLIDYVLR